jgi:predicted aldo/keto reductase-like oxidoreductase
MQYRRLGKTGLKVSALGFGCMRLPTLGAPDRIDEEAATDLLHRAIDSGVNYVDTAWFYHAPGQGQAGQSEPFVGRALAGPWRDRVLLATKLPQQIVGTKAELESFLPRQLERLATDRIDMYLVHGLNGEAWDKMKALGIREYLEKARNRGLIGHIGFSFHGEAADFLRIVDDFPGWEFCQIQYNYLDVKNQAGRSGLRYAAEKGLGVVVMEPLRGGRLAGLLPPQMKAVFDGRPEGWSPAEWALRFVWDEPGVGLLLSGMNAVSQLEENLRVAESALPGSLGDERGAVYEAAGEAMRKLRKADCTACRYCQPCPAGVQIPECLAALNASSIWNTNHPWVTGYASIKGKPGLCTQCGACEGLCPQSLPIRALLAETAEVFSGKAAS